MHRRADLSALESLSVTDLPSTSALPDQFPLELCRCTEDLQEESRCRISLVRVESLGDGNESDATALQDLDVVETVHQGAAKPVQLPN
jgi:hypothetical protein